MPRAATPRPLKAPAQTPQVRPPAAESAAAETSTGLPRRLDVFEDAGLASIRSRALAYLHAGAPVHFRGPAGMGKTTLALHIAHELGRPVALVTGDSGITSADLLGREVGHETRALRDQYVSRVVKAESTTRAAWVDSVLTRAVAEGHTLVYDEFTRSPPEANNALLSALEEGVLVFTSPVRQGRYVRAHPDFRCILTSNPDEYVGVSAAPDALFDRMITFDLTWCPAETETGIVARRSGMALSDARAIVTMVRALRDRAAGANPPSIRTAIMIARILMAQGVPADAADERFVQICLDVLETRAPRSARPEARAAYLADLRTQILAACPPGSADGPRAAPPPLRPMPPVPVSPTPDPTPTPARRPRARPISPVPPPPPPLRESAA